MDTNNKSVEFPFDDVNWAINVSQVEFIGERHFTYNEQSVTLTCVCSTKVEVFDHSSATCPKCGRVYQLETKITVGWENPTR